MTFDEFKVAYTTAFKRMMSYTPDQIGSQTYAEEMAKLSDAHPDWAEKVESEDGTTLIAISNIKAKSLDEDGAKHIALERLQPMLFR